MASVRPRRYVVVVLHVGGFKLADIKLVSQREPSSGKTWFPVGSMLSNEEHVDVVVRELHEKIGLILTHDDLTMLSDAPVRVALRDGQHLCCEIPVVGIIMDTSIRRTRGESWPYYLANSGCAAGARCSGSTGVYV
jgi:8-oxo-dGTP pyrophosphatase MutT (NUDIX family)